MKWPSKNTRIVSLVGALNATATWQTSRQYSRKRIARQLARNAGHAPSSPSLRQPGISENAAGASAGTFAAGSGGHGQVRSAGGSLVAQAETMAAAARPKQKLPKMRRVEGL